MRQDDLRLRRATYELFVSLGRAPTADEVARTSGCTRDEVLAGWRWLHEQHAIVLDSSGTHLLMANPFAAVPTAYRVRARDRWWYANCAWDAFGVCAALHVDGRIETSCADCGDPIVVNVQGQQPDDDALLFHCLVPARRWWEDIVFT